MNGTISVRDSGLAEMHLGVTCQAPPLRDHAAHGNPYQDQTKDRGS